MQKRKYRVIIIGAGFSKPAGLPLADELWYEILRRSKSLGGRASKLNDDLEAYVAFRRDCDGIELTKEAINFEEFLGFLDIEHYFGMRGSDTWSRDGNEGQVVIKTLIGEILTKSMPHRSSIPRLYLEFANRLQPNDYVITFNYDVLLERALDAVGKPYRLFPHRYKSVSKHGSIVDSSKEEVIILKVHGSIDWFDKSQYQERLQHYKQVGAPGGPKDILFDGRYNWGLKKLVEGPRDENDHLSQIYRVAHIEDLYKQEIIFSAVPRILSPSTNKVLYSSPLKEFWNGFGAAGVTNFGVGIIGYSLPTHDFYARQAIYSLVKNYQEQYWDEGLFGYKKSSLVLVDYRNNEQAQENFRQSYRFVDFAKAELHMSGFDEAAIEKIFV